MHQHNTTGERTISITRSRSPGGCCVVPTPLGTCDRTGEQDEGIWWALRAQEAGENIKKRILAPVGQLSASMSPWPAPWLRRGFTHGPFGSVFVPNLRFGMTGPDNGTRAISPTFETKVRLEPQGLGNKTSPEAKNQGVRETT